MLQNHASLCGYSKRKLAVLPIKHFIFKVSKNPVHLYILYIMIQTRRSTINWMLCGYTKNLWVRFITKAEWFGEPIVSVVQHAAKQNIRTAWLQLIDMFGNKIKAITLSYLNNTVTFDIKDLSKGIYTYKYIVNNMNVETGKLVIE